jgi:hypothetical protein
LKDQLDDLEAVRKLVEILEPFDSVARERILRWSCEKLGMPGMMPGTAEKSVATVESDVEQASKTNRTAPSIRAFVHGRKISDRQFAIVAAYFYRFEASDEEKKVSISAEDVVEACRKAGRKRPARARQTLVNAVTAGYLDKAGRGNYKINSAGENLVVQLMNDVVEAHLGQE